MSYPDGLTVVTVQHRVVDEAGRPLPGHVTVTLSDRLWTADGSVLPVEYTAPLNDGQWEVTVPAVDDEMLTPQGAAYRVTEHVPGRPRSYYIAPLVEDAPGPVDVVDVLSPKPAPGGGVTRTDPELVDAARDSAEAAAQSRVASVDAAERAEQAEGRVPDGVTQLTPDTMRFTRDGLPILEEITLPPGPQGDPGPNAIPGDEFIADRVLVRDSLTRAALSEKLVPATILASDYCAEDGVTDDGPAWQEALDDLITAGGGEFRLTPGRTYLIDTDVDVAAAGMAVRVVATGARVLAGPDVTTVLRIGGTSTQLAGGDSAYDATVIGATTLNTAVDLTGDLAAGDWLMIWSSDADNAERPTQYMSGEEAVVVEVTSSTITLDRPIRLTHTGEEQRRLYRLDLTPTPRIIGFDVTLHPSGGRQVGVNIEHALHPRAEGFHASGKNGRYGIRLHQCIGGVLDGPQVETLYDASNGTAPNGIAALLNGCIGTVVNQPRAKKTRHCVDINSFSSPTNPGLVSRDIVINDPEGIGTYSPPMSIHHARDTVLNHPVVIACGGGVHTRGFNTTIRDFRPVGGSTAKPDEWDVARFVPSGVAVGETDALPPGEGLAGANLTIENYDPRSLPDDWQAISWSDRPLDGVRISGPTFVVAPDVVMSDSGDRADGPVGNADLAYGGIPSYGNWGWQQGSAGVEIVAGRFARPGGVTGHGLRTPADVPADAEVSVTWEQVGTPSVSNGIFLRGAGDNTVTNGVFLGVAADGSISIFRRLAGSSSAALATSDADTVLDGDRIALRAVGRQLTVLVNGSVVLEASSMDVLGAGRAGFYFRNSGNEGWAASRFVVRDLT